MIPVVLVARGRWVAIKRHERIALLLKFFGHFLLIEKESDVLKHPRAGLDSIEVGFLLSHGPMVS